jgi:general stress protein 26
MNKKIVSIRKEDSLHAYLATCDGDQPRVRPVSPIVEDDMSIWVTTYGTCRKVRQLRENPKACLTFVQQPDGDKAVTVVGEAKIIADLREKKRVWKLVNFDLYQHFPDGPESDEFCLLRIIIKSIEWRESRTAKGKVYEPAQQSTTARDSKRDHVSSCNRAYFASCLWHCGQVPQLTGKFGYIDPYM